MTKRVSMTELTVKSGQSTRPMRHYFLSLMEGLGINILKENYKENHNV